MILQREQLDILEKEVRNFNHSIDEEAQKNPVAVDRRKMNEDTELRDRVETFEHLFNALRQELHRFAAKWM
jgi:DNA repair exonuclease SbcCD ATPase subunit